MSGRFVHLIDLRHPHHVGKQPSGSNLPGRLIEPLVRFLPPRRVARIAGIRSAHGSAEGWLVTAGPRKGEAVVRFARRMGARVVGLGPLASTLGERIIALARDQSIGITSGAALAASFMVDVVREAAQLMGLDLRSAEAVILDTSGSAGRVLALTVAKVAGNLTLVGADERALDRLAAELLTGSGVSAQISANPRKGLQAADLVIVAAGDGAIDPDWLKPGAILLDVAGSVNGGAIEGREDVLILRGGLVRVPGDVDFGLGAAYPHATCDASLAETILLALEDRYENCISKDWSVDGIEAIGRLASKHGFRFAGLQGPAGIITAADIARIKKNT